MKILGIVGSPRVEGNTQKLVEMILASAAENGAETKIFNLNKLNIKGCQSCYHCKTTDEGCIVKDDMQQLYNELGQTDGVIISSPIYMWQISGQLKVFTDRLFAFIGPDFKNKLGRKKSVLVFTHGNPNEKMFKDYIDQTTRMYKFLGFDVKDVMIAGGLRKPGTVSKKDKLVQKTKELGEILTKG